MLLSRQRKVLRERGTWIQSVSLCQSGSSLFVLVLVFSPSPHSNKKENLLATMLANWASQEEVDTDSSNEEEDTVRPDEPLEADPSANLPSNTNKYALYTVLH